MKIATGLATCLIAFCFGAGEAHATVCTTSSYGDVNGLFSASPDLTAVETSDVKCLSDPTFGWNNSIVAGVSDPDLVFTTSANLTANDISITMYTGATGGFKSNAIWTLSLPNGLVFDSVELDYSEFRFGSGSFFDEDTLSFTGVGSSSIIFTILGQDGIDNFYDAGALFSGVFNISVSQPNVVPEPAGWLLALTSLGILGAVRRRQSPLIAG